MTDPSTVQKHLLEIEKLLNADNVLPNGLNRLKKIIEEICKNKDNDKELHGAVEKHYNEVIENIQKLPLKIIENQQLIVLIILVLDELEFYTRDDYLDFRKKIFEKFFKKKFHKYASILWKILNEIYSLLEDSPHNELKSKIEKQKTEYNNKINEKIKSLNKNPREENPRKIEAKNLESIYFESNNQSSKIKRIFIELHDYNFCHGPSEVGSNNDYFVGRERIIEKVKNIIRDTSKKSGCYLVTGYRGMGKTSFVNKVIDTLTNRNRLYKLFFKILLFTISTYFFSIVMIEIAPKGSNKPFYIIIGLILGFLIGLFYLISIKDKKNKLSPAYIYSEEKPLLEKYLVYLVLTLFLTIICNLIFLFSHNECRWTAFYIILTIQIISVFTGKKEKTNIFRKQHISDYLNNSRRITIKLNLGYSNLKEIDILRLLAKQIKTEYKKHNKTFTINKLFRIFLKIIILLTVLLSYQSSLVSKFENEFLKSFHSTNQEKSTIAAPKLGIQINVSGSQNGQSTVINQESSITNLSSKYWDSIIALDSFLKGTYEEVRPLMPFPLNTEVFIPRPFSYFFFMYSATALGIIIIVVNHFSRQRRVIRKMNFLNDLIDSTLSYEYSSSAKVPSNIFGGIFRRTKTYPRADEREIEKRLIEIIDELDNLPFYRHPVNFLFVFDELDKIEPPINIDEKSNNLNLTSPQENIRKRQQTVMELLSNLKYFLSTAKAKFIFIAGRELYDASLADISDRNSRIGSIFHDVFYIESFFSDLNPFGFDDIISRTEQFICQFLIPQSYIEEKRKEEKRDNLKREKKLEEYQNLHYYNLYLIEKFFDEFDESFHFLRSEKIITRQKREKVIIILQQFITYLNHVSTGAPSKLKTYFENFIIPPSAVDEFPRNSLLAGAVNENKVYLFFDFYDQYKIGLINYLMVPINVTINRNIKNFSDKLIVSASFLHDHLFKFHRNAFAWRDLEAIPEMVDLNKNPETRDFLRRLIQFMLNVHIQPIENDLYDFKFPKRLAQEIAFLSHVDDESSANFNFTLDESQAVKQYFKDQYKRFESLIRPSGTTDKKYIFTQSSLHLSLADLSYYDEELGEAVMYYNEAMRKMRDNVDKITRTQLAMLIRDMLKLGHTLEKRHTYDVAFLTYTEIKTEIQRQVIWFQNAEYPENAWQNILIENIRLFYQPILSQLYLIEKKSKEGITFSNVEDALYDFHSIISKVSPKNKPRILSEFYNKMGDLLYYKNLKEERCTKNCPLQKHPPEMNSYSITGCVSCSWYYTSIRALLKNLEHKAKSFFQIIWDNYISKNPVNDLSDLSLLATSISDAGDTFLSCERRKSDDVEVSNFLKGLVDDKVNSKEYFIQLIKYLDHLKDDSIAKRLKIPFVYYYLSAKLFEKAGEYNSCAFQYIKMLYLIRERVFSNKKIKNREEYSELVNLISSEAIKNKYKANEGIHLYEIERDKAMFNKKGVEKLDPENISLNILSLNSEIDEISVLVLEIKIKLDIETKDTRKRVFQMVNPYSLNTNMYGRFLKLRMKALYNETVFSELMLLGNRNKLESPYKNEEEKKKEVKKK